MSCPHRLVAALVVMLLVAEPSGFAAQSSAMATAQTSAAAAPEDKGWPRQISKNGATLVYYHPRLMTVRTIRSLIAKSLSP